MCTCPGLRACSADVQRCRVRPNRAFDSSNKLAMNIVRVPAEHVAVAPGVGVCVGGIDSVEYKQQTYCVLVT